MTDRDEDRYYKLVLHKLKALTIDGVFNSADVVAYYEYDWDKNKTLEDNLPGALKEHGALSHLIKSGVIDGDQSENLYRKQQLSGEADWSDWGKAPASMREFDQATVIYLIDIQKFEEQLAKAGLVDEGTKLRDVEAPTRLLKLTPRSYDEHSGVLHFQGKSIIIVKQKNRLEPRNETMQARAMRLLFVSVNSLKDGVPLRRIATSQSVNPSTITHKQREQAKNHIDEINRKIKEVTGINKMINYTSNRFYVDERYLKK